DPSLGGEVERHLAPVELALDVAELDRHPALGDLLEAEGTRALLVGHLARVGLLVVVAGAADHLRQPRGGAVERGGEDRGDHGAELRAGLRVDETGLPDLERVTLRIAVAGARRRAQPHTDDVHTACTIPISPRRVRWPDKKRERTRSRSTRATAPPRTNTI